jgi:murein tripeptide amidase MpaA
MQLSKLILFIAATLATPSQKAFYKDHKVVEISNTPTTHKLLEKLHADIWSENSQVAKVRVSPSQFDELKSQLPKDSKFNVLVEDVQKTIDDANEDSVDRSADWFAAYHSYDEIKAWYTQHAQNNAGVVKLVPSIGKTLQGNDIFAVHLTNPNGAAKKKIWFESLIHAREWITGTTTQYIFNEFLTKRQSDPTIKSLLDQVEIIFIPVVNPDGYKYTQTQRLWRKNRNGSGVDLNRNFPFHWGGPGASTDPNSETYRGKSAGSELETQAITKYYSAQGPIAGGIDWHSYSELILRPWGDTQANSPHEAQHKQLGDGIRDKIRAVRGKVYTSQKSIGLYPTSGTANDWFYGAKGSYGYTIELSPNANAANGFVLPPSEIIPVGKDLLPAAIHFIDFVLKNPIN